MRSLSTFFAPVIMLFFSTASTATPLNALRQDIAISSRVPLDSQNASNQREPSTIPLCRGPLESGWLGVSLYVCGPVLNRIPRDRTKQRLTTTDVPAVRVVRVPLTPCEVKVVGLALHKSAEFSWVQVHDQAVRILRECDYVGFGGSLYFAPGFFVSVRAQTLLGDPPSQAAGALLPGSTLITSPAMRQGKDITRM